MKDCIIIVKLQRIMILLYASRCQKFTPISFSQILFFHKHTWIFLILFGRNDKIVYALIFIFGSFVLDTNVNTVPLAETTYFFFHK